jgi:dephospho-CoA kinase
MLKLKKVAITGGLASGKTAVCRFFEELGSFVVSADAIVHDLLESNTQLEQQIVQQFGPQVLVNGKVHRAMLAEEAFSSPQQLKKLEELLHPAVLAKIEEYYTRACHSESCTSFVVEVPLLFEIHGESFYDCVIAVLADESLARLRFKQAGFQPKEYDRRRRRQLSPIQKAKRADYTIQNNGTFDDIKKQVITLKQIINC